MREHAIIEERERIARELHDGLSQLLGYINTKANAVRLLLSKWQIRIAENQLLQLEEAAQGLFLDVREAIIGLKVSGRVGDNMANTLQECTRSFSRLSDIPIEVDIDPQIEALTFCRNRTPPAAHRPDFAVRDVTADPYFTGSHLAEITQTEFQYWSARQ